LDSLRNVEQDEAGKLRAFRKKFGRGWDLDDEGEVEDNVAAGGKDGKKGGDLSERERERESGNGGSLMDLISTAAGGEQKRLGAKGKKGKM
jgi:hypothetical protein